MGPSYGSAYPGRLGSSYGGPMGYADVTSIRRISGTYGIGRAPFGYGGGPDGYIGDGQFAGAAYDGYIDDTGLGVDGNYGGSGCHQCSVHGGQPAVSVDPPQGGGTQCTCHHQVSSGGQTADGQKAQCGGEQAQAGGQQAQTSGQQTQCGAAGQVTGQVQVSVAPTGCAMGQAAVGQGTIDLQQVGQATMISPTSEGKGTSTTSSDSEKED